MKDRPLLEGVRPAVALCGNVRDESVAKMRALQKKEEEDDVPG
jgi:hypothetical protein